MSHADTIVESVRGRTRIVLILSFNTCKRWYKRSAAQSSNRGIVSDESLIEDFNHAILVLDASKYTFTTS